MRPGAAPTQVSSTTRRSTPGTRCPNTRADQRVEPVLRVHVDRRQACNLASLNLMKFRREDGELDVEAFEHAVDVDLPRPGDPRRQLVVPDARDRTECEGLPPARPRLREPRRTADGARAPLRLRRGPCLRRGDHRADDRSRLPQIGRDRRADGTVRRLPAERGRDDRRDREAPRRGREHRRAADRAGRPARRARGKRGTTRSTSARSTATGTHKRPCIAPTGTISFQMDCDTTGLEPDFSLVKSKKLVGGGEITIVNKTVPLGLEKLGYAPNEVAEIVAYHRRAQHDRRRALRQVRALPGLRLRDRRSRRSITPAT